MTDPSSQPPRQPPRSPRSRTHPRRPSATRVLLFLSALVAMVFLVAGGALVWLLLSVDRGEVRQESFAHVHLRGPIQDSPPRAPTLFAPDEPAPVVTSLTRGIRAAADDDRIEGLFLELDMPLWGWGLAQEVRDAIVDFRDSGKPCVAYGSAFQTIDYYVASACDEVVLAPAGLTAVLGIATHVSYFSDMFDKLGVEPDFEHVGDYKVAIEPYERTGPSEEAVESYDLLLDDVWQGFLNAVADGRGLEPADVQALVDEPALSARGALEAGLVDALAYRDAVIASLPDVGADAWHDELAEASLGRNERQHLTPIGEVLKEIHAQDRRQRQHIAVVHAEGPIVSGEAEDGLFAGASLSDGIFRRWMREVRQDDQVRAVVLRVNSPGGSALAADMMWREIKLTQEAGKPVVVSMAGSAASGGYLISAPADHIVAQPGTVTGSIGVFGGKLTFGETLDHVGVSTHAFKRGDLADLLSVVEPFSEEGRAVFRAYLEDFYGVFLDRVAEGRDLSIDEAHEIGQGRVWTGNQALERGLVDELGGLDEALAKAAELAEIERYGLQRLPRRRGLLEVLLDDMSQALTPSVEVDLPFPGAEEALAEVKVLKRVLGTDGAAAYLPGDPRIR